MEIRDMPKLKSPFKRVMSDEANVSLVTPEVARGYSWVFEDDDVMATEKLHGTNVSIVVQSGTITHIYNRKNPVMTGGLRVASTSGSRYIIEGVLNSVDKGYCNLTDGQYFGELLGPKFHGNPYRLDSHLWVPFSYVKRKLRYKTWGDYPKTYEVISEWFRDGLVSLANMYWNGDKEGFVEGIVFHHPDGRMAKLRRDMFDWYWEALDD